MWGVVVGVGGVDGRGLWGSVTGTIVRTPKKREKKELSQN